MSARPPLAVLCALVLSWNARGADDWPQSRRDAQNSAAIELSVPGSAPARAWSFEGAGRVLGYEPGMTVWSSPALARVQDRALLAVGCYDHRVYALDAATGEVQWKYPTGGPVYAAPSLWSADQRVWLFAGSSDRSVYALDAADGRRAWSTSLADYRPTLGGARVSTPVVGRAGQIDAVFVASWVWDRSVGQSLQRSTVTALSARDGRLLWSHVLGDNELAAPVYAVVGGRGALFVGSFDGNVFALDAQDGHQLWKRTELDAVRSPPAVVDEPDGALVVLGSKYGVVRAVRATDGVERWHVKTADRVVGSPAVARLGDRLLVLAPSYDRHLYGIDARSGQVLWRYGARAGLYASPAVATAASPPLVVAPAWDHALHAMDLRDGRGLFAWHTGRPLWDVSGLDASNWSAPALARLNGSWVAFVGSYDGALRALPVDAAGAGVKAVDRSAVAFWLSFPATLVPLCGLALWLTRRHRARNRPP